MLKNNLETRSLAFAGLLALIAIFFSITHSQISHREASALLMAPPPEVEHFHFGYRENIADSLWVRVINDFNLCDQPIGEKLCKGQSWVYKMLLGIYKLSPHFRAPLLIGPVMLTIIVNDMQGASDLFDIAVSVYPKDWRILYAASYHAIYEEENWVKAGHLLEEAGKNGAPTWTLSLATKMYSKGGKQELAQHLYNEMKNSAVPEPLLKEMRKRSGLPDEP